MTWPQRLLSAAAVTVIFASGFVTGRLAGGPSGEPDADEDPAFRTGAMRGTRERVDYLDSQLDLDPDQEQRLTDVLDAWEKDTRQRMIDDTRERLAILERHYPAMRAVMNDDQAGDFEDIMRQLRRRQRQMVERMERQFDRRYGS